MRPPVKDHFGVRTHEVRSEVTGTGTLIVDDTPIVPVDIRDLEDRNVEGTSFHDLTRR